MQIYVGNLPNGYRLSDLVQVFETYGCVSRASAVRDFAFLAIYDNEAARAAVNGLNGNMFGDQEIVVEPARFHPRGRFQNSRGAGFVRSGALPQQRGQNGGEGYRQQSNNVAASGYYHEDNEEGYQGDTGSGAHGEGYLNGGQVRQHAENYGREDPNQRVGQEFGRGGRRGGFRSGHAGRRAGGSRIYRSNNNASNGHDDRVQNTTEDHGRHFANTENSMVGAVRSNANKTETPDANPETNNSQHMAEENVVGDSGRRRRGGARRAGRGNRGPRGGRRVPRGDPNNSHAYGPQGQPTRVPQIPTPGGSGENNATKTESAGNGLPVQNPAGGDGVVTDKGRSNGGSGDTRLPRNTTAVN